MLQILTPCEEFNQMEVNFLFSYNLDLNESNQHSCPECGSCWISLCYIFCHLLSDYSLFFVSFFHMQIYQCNFYNHLSTFLVYSPRATADRRITLCCTLLRYSQYFQYCISSTQVVETYKIIKKLFPLPSPTLGIIRFN